MKTTAMIIGAFLLISVIFLSIYLQPNDFALCPQTTGRPDERDGCQAVDAIVAVSGGDTESRTQHAIELYNNGWAPLLIFSGAAQDKSGPSNALTMRRQAIEAGVPARAVLIEENSENTEENAKNTVFLLETHQVKKVILVTSGYHQRRASLEFNQKISGSEVTIQNSPTTDADWSGWWWLTPRGWWLAVGEFVKIIIFYAGAGH